MVDMADGRHAEHGVVGLTGGVGPVVAQPGLVVRPVRDVRDAGHTEDRDEEDGLVDGRHQCSVSYKQLELLQ